VSCWKPLISYRCFATATNMPSSYLTARAVDGIRLSPLNFSASCRRNSTLGDGKGALVSSCLILN